MIIRVKSDFCGREMIEEEDECIGAKGHCNGWKGGWQYNGGVVKRSGSGWLWHWWWWLDARVTRLVGWTTGCKWLRTISHTLCAVHPIGHQPIPLFHLGYLVEHPPLLLPLPSLLSTSPILLLFSSPISIYIYIIYII